MRLANLVSLQLLSKVIAPSHGQEIFSGIRTSLRQEDSVERGQGPELGDYLGIPINEAGRLFAES